MGGIGHLLGYASHFPSARKPGRADVAARGSHIEELKPPPPRYDDSCGVGRWMSGCHPVAADDTCPFRTDDDVRLPVHCPRASVNVAPLGEAVVRPFAALGLLFFACTRQLTLSSEQRTLSPSFSLLHLDALIPV